MIEYELEPLDREMRPDSDLRHAGLSNRETVTRTALELLAAGTPIGIPGREVTCIWVDKRMGPRSVGPCQEVRSRTAKAELTAVVC